MSWLNMMPKGGGAAGDNGHEINIVPPYKTEYIPGEAFDRTGMVVTVIINGESVIVTDYTVSPEIITATTTKVLIGYSLANATGTAALDITVLNVSATLADNDWETIARVSAAGKASDFWAVGDEKTETLNGAAYTFQIIGFDHDDLDVTDARYSDANYNGGSGKAGITFQTKEATSETYKMNDTSTNVGGWADTLMRSSTMQLWESYMPSELQGVLRTVSKLTSEGNRSSVVVATADKLFLPSELEVFGTTEFSFGGEGTRYEYYVAGNSSVKIMRGSTAVTYWLLRSPTKTNNTNFNTAATSGGVSTSGASSGRRISPCCCL